MNTFHHGIGGEKLGGLAGLPGGGIVSGVHHQSEIESGAVIGSAASLDHHPVEEVYNPEFAQVFYLHRQEIISLCGEALKP